MKSTLLLIFFLGLSTAFSQTSYSEEVNQVSSQIDGVRSKIVWVKSVPQEDSIAVAQGWYEQMGLQLDKLTDQKRNLIRTETGKRWVSIEEFEETSTEKQAILIADQTYIIEQH